LQNLTVADLFVALIHYPVLDRNGRVVTSAITSLDLHDLARSARTYDVRAMYVVHPVAEQREFALRVLDHWRLDYGRLYDSRRREALELVEVVEDLELALKATKVISRAFPLLVYTSASATGGVSYAELRRRLEDTEGPPILLMFGTGFGLASSIRERADIVLDAVRGPGAYNHLSVRAAASVILDRLAGRRAPV
jgi:hypothetical protein